MSRSRKTSEKGIVPVGDDSGPKQASGHVGKPKEQGDNNGG